MVLLIAVTLEDKYTIVCDVTLVQVLAMFASRHDLMSERSAHDQWRYVFDGIIYQVIKGN